MTDATEHPLAQRTPKHGGTILEMLEAAAVELDRYDEIFRRIQINTGSHAGKTIADLTGQNGEMQEDIRFAASVIRRLTEVTPT